MLNKGQKVELTVAGLSLIRMETDGKIRTHRNGKPFASTGVVLSSAEYNRERVVIRLDSQSKSSKGDSYDVQYWQAINTDSQQCYICDEISDQEGVFRVLARGPREGQKIGPLCSGCERDMESKVLLMADSSRVTWFEAAHKMMLVIDDPLKDGKPAKEQVETAIKWFDATVKARGTDEQIEQSRKMLVINSSLPVKDILFNPDYSTPPGDTLDEVLKDKGMTHLQAARLMCGCNMSLFEVQENIEFIKRAILEPNTVIEITKEMASRLAILCSTQQFWLNRFNNHNAFLARSQKLETAQ